MNIPEPGRVHSSPLLLEEVLEIGAGRWPHRELLVHGDHRVTFAGLETRANQLAAGLIAAGVGPADRVVLLLPNSVTMVEAIFAILKAGAVFVPLHTGTKRERLVSFMNDCTATALISGVQALREIGDIRAEVPSVTLVASVGGDAAGATELAHLFVEDAIAAPPKRITSADLACLIYTSGTTGQPKGVMMGHDNALFAIRSVIRSLDNTEDDVIACGLSLAHSYGLYQVFMAAYFGGKVVLLDSLAYPAAILDAIERERVTGVPGVPSLWAILLQVGLDRHDLSSLRYLTNAAAPLPREHLERLLRDLPGISIYCMHGLTECKRTLSLDAAAFPDKHGSVGMAIPGTDAWVADPQGNRLPNGSTGELVIRGPHVMRGYWGNPEATAKRFRPGPTPGERLLYTGDLFRTDEDGYFFFVSRMDDIINAGGNKVAPVEVENVLHQIPGVVQSAVAPMSDPILGEAVKAFIVA
ncbi:MAG: AMP-dependent synthetase, partial [Actinobacteria bacterium]